MFCVVCHFSVIRDALAECQVSEGQKIELKQRTQQLVLQAHVSCVHVQVYLSWACAAGRSFPSFPPPMVPSPVQYLNVTAVHRNEWGKELLRVWDVNLQDLLKPWGKRMRRTNEAGPDPDHCHCGGGGRVHCNSQVLPWHGGEVRQGRA